MKLGWGAYVTAALAMCGHGAAQPCDMYDETPLLRAASSGDIDEVRALLADGADPNESIAGCWPPPLVWAVDHVEIVDALLAAGADPEGSPHFETPLMSAAESMGQNVDVVERLLRAGASPNAQLPDGTTALMLLGSPLMARALIHGGASVNARDARGRSALLIALEQGDEPVVNELLAAGADLGDLVTDRLDKLLLSAASEGRAGEVAALLGQGVDPDAMRWVEPTPLYLAASAGHWDVARILFDGGADRRCFEHVLKWAISDRCVSCVESLLSLGASAASGDPLWVAALIGQMGIAGLLIQHGAPIDGEPGGTTPLMAAIGERQYDMAAFLLDRGAQPDVRRVWTPDSNTFDMKPGTALGAAILRGDTVIVRILLEHGADPNADARPGGSAPLPSDVRRADTPLCAAVRRGSAELVRLLLASGADPNGVDGMGESPLMVLELAQGAAAATRDEIRRLLVQAGAAP